MGGDDIRGGFVGGGHSGDGDGERQRKKAMSTQTNAHARGLPTSNGDSSSEGVNDLANECGNGGRETSVGFSGRPA